ncbi:MAG: hypothetical protein ACPGXX_11645 [Planctomycetaceae bacterium]
MSSEGTEAGDLGSSRPLETRLNDGHDSLQQRSMAAAALVVNHEQWH